MLGAGAAHYTSIDRFPGNYSSPKAKEIYKNVVARWNDFFPEIEWDTSIKPDGFPENLDHRVRLIARPIETVYPGERFDTLCSFQVGEHVSDIQAFADIHNRLLKTDGVGLHRVDFGPHDVWSLYSDPTTFLRFPDFIWKLTGSNRGIPNRRRHHEFLDAFSKADLDVDVLLLEHFDESSVDFSTLNRRFRQMDKDSLLVKTALYRVTRKAGYS